MVAIVVSFTEIRGLLMPLFRSIFLEEVSSSVFKRIISGGGRVIG